MIMGHVGDTAFLPEQKPISPGHVGDTAFFARAKIYITTFGHPAVLPDCSVLFCKHVMVRPFFILNIVYMYIL